MATVHRAIERGIEGFERVVALKRLLPHLAEDEDFVRAFVREAKLASMLHHGNIVQLYELGRVGASYFISMEYIPGRDLRLILRQARRVAGPPPVEITLAFLAELLDALDYAHGQCGPDGRPLGLVHRDISPSNLIVSQTGHLKIIDFGIAKETLGHLMTHTGRIKGKLPYMAPEVLSGRTLDGRSDLFSASVIAHELLTATPLFAARDDFQIIDRLQNMQPPPPSAKNPSSSRELDALVLRGLAKDPAQRWRSAAEMRGALAELTAERHRMAASREICDWIEEAFQLPVPPRLRLPLTAPAEGPELRRAGTGEGEDDVMDMVWGGSGPRSPISSSPLGPAGMAARSSDSHSHSHSHAQPFPAVASAGPASTTPGFVTRPTRATLRPGSMAVQPPGALAANHRWTSRPSEWAVGTSPTSQDTGPSLPSRPLPRRQSAIPLLLASVAVASAGGLIAWIVARNTGDPPPSQVAAITPPSAPLVQPLPPSQAGEAPPPAPPAAPPSGTPGAVDNGAAGEATGSPSDPEPAQEDVVQEAAVDDEAASRAARKAEKEARHEEEADRGHGSRKRRSARDRDHGRDRGDEAESRSSERREGDEPERGEDGVATAADVVESSDSTPADTVERPPPASTAPPASSSPTRAAQDDAGASSSKGSKSDSRSVTERAPQPSETDTATRRAAAPPATRGPIAIAASRTRREGGDSRPIRLPRGEQPPPQVVTKVCIDARGSVVSVKALSPVSPGVRNAMERAVMKWRYRPVVENDEKVAACFATPVKLQVE
jgi:eukaryotic-like serine/threonine-protein kinase